jgi:hypothetical protein
MIVQSFGNAAHLLFFKYSSLKIFALHNLLSAVEPNSAFYRSIVLFLHLRPVCDKKETLLRDDCMTVCVFPSVFFVCVGAFKKLPSATGLRNVD